MGRGGSNYRPELRERAIRMVAEVRPEYPSGVPRHGRQVELERRAGIEQRDLGAGKVADAAGV